MVYNIIWNIIRTKGAAALKERKNDGIAEAAYCENCEHAALLHGDEYVLCEKKGVVRATYVCRKFSYDPLKRRPAKAAAPKLEFVDIDS